MKTFNVRAYNIFRFIAILITLDIYKVVIVEGSDEISNHIRKCCRSGLLKARVSNNCANYEYDVAAIPPLWRGLCSATYGVCCSREIENQHCVSGRLAARTGSRCIEESSSNSTSTSYANCCRSCQVGLAVRASKNNCNDELFSYFANIESYRNCCFDETDQPERQIEHDPNIDNADADRRGSHEEVNIDEDANDNANDDGKSKNSIQKIYKENISRTLSEELIENAADDEDGTIVLREDDDDICGKVPKLCEHICENTKEGYRCKCRPGFKLDDSNITCTPVIGSVPALPLDDDASNKLPPFFAEEGKANLTNDEDINDDYNGASLEDTADANIKPDGFMEDDYKMEICRSGYEQDYRKKCIDVDECIMKLANCKSNQYCHNTIGSYRCLNRDNDQQQPQQEIKCSEGFQLKHERCVDIDECATDRNACDSSQICTNDIGGYHCDCEIGFNLDTTINACVDINECSINNHNCLPTQRCDNTVGSYICTRLQSCGTGYTLNAETAHCDDDDECILKTHNCQPDYECFNTKGSFRCYRRPPSTTPKTTTTTMATTTATSTPARVTFSSSGGGVVYPPNDASYSQHYRNRTHHFPQAPPAYVSHQTHTRPIYGPDNESPPRYNIGANSIRSMAPCENGFQRNYLGACVDVNECLSTNPCKSHQRCINTNGSYRCQNLLQCAAGYKSTPDGQKCIDIDECETGEHNCAENQICRNRNGGFICSCPPGHQLTLLSNGRNRCTDVNECEPGHRPAPSVCQSNAECLNTIGSYYCECKSGFQKSKDNDRLCLDVDECQTIPGLCQEKCVNFWGGYYCTCNPGYELSSDNRTCNDVDECEVHKSYKLCMGFCNNVPGSYECSCPRGYTLETDKTSCRDIDECASGDFCTGRHDVCTNIRGSYKCTTIHCPYGYVNDPDQKNRCRQTSNLCEDNECYNKPSAYTYNFITLVSKLMIPPEGRTIFSLRGPSYYEIQFDLKIIKIQAAANIEKASNNHFDTIKSKREVQLTLRRTLEGPQDIELDLTMKVFTNGMPRGESVAKIFILVSQYTF